MTESQFEKLEHEEIERRVDYLGKNIDTNQSDFGKGNWIAAIITMIGSFILLVWGAFL